ncbi:hypothetical protein, partial [Salmonella enterica]|uniref:hypothetical protein n=1 Tax=Salmonella enterica TaxID=28901 RepID=UPI001CA4E449
IFLHARDPPLQPAFLLNNGYDQQTELSCLGHRIFLHARDPPLQPAFLLNNGYDQQTELSWFEGDSICLNNCGES